MKWSELEETLRGAQAQAAVGESRATPRRQSSSTGPAGPPFARATCVSKLPQPGEKLREGYEHASKERQSDVSGV